MPCSSPPQRAARMVRRGWRSRARRMRMASRTMMVPAPSSVAPVPAIQLSRWPPSMTTWSLSAGSDPGISARTFSPWTWSPVNWVWILRRTDTGTSCETRRCMRWKASLAMTAEGMGCLCSGAVDEPAEGDVGVIVKNPGRATGAECGDGVLVGEEAGNFLLEGDIFKGFFPFGGVGREDEGFGLITIERVRA